MNLAIQLTRQRNSGDSSSSFLEFVAGLVIKAIGFQIKLLVIFVTYPTLFLFHCCMFFVDPFGTMRKSKAFFIGIWVESGVLCFGALAHMLKECLRRMFQFGVWHFVVDGGSYGQSMFVAFC